MDRVRAAREHADLSRQHREDDPGGSAVPGSLADASPRGGRHGADAVTDQADRRGAAGPRDRRARARAGHRPRAAPRPRLRRRAHRAAPAIGRPRLSRPVRVSRLPIVVFVAVAAAYVYVTAWLGAQADGIASWDIYAAHFPNLLYALDSLRRGHGLLWNSLQNCGQPFVPATLVGVLYPLQLVFLLVSVDTGLLVMAWLHLALAGAFAYWFCRENGVGRIAAVCGGLTFMLGGACAQLAAWLPTTILGPYVWLPAAAAVTERVLRRPSWGNAIGLAACLTMSLLPGYPQITLFIYQFIGLRTLWELATRRAARRLEVVGALLLGGALPLAFAAVSLLAFLEFAARSIRGGNLSSQELAVTGMVSWPTFAVSGGALTNGFLPVFALVPTVLAAVAFTRRANWRPGTFYVLVALLYLGLASSARLFGLYAALPLGSLFRVPRRFLWMGSFTPVVPVALGVEAVIRPAAARGRAVAITLAGLGVGVLVFAIVSRQPYLPMERWTLGLLALAVMALTLLPARLRPAVALALPALLLVNLFSVETGPFLRRLPDPAPIWRHADAFAFVREHITPFDRIHVLGVHQDYGLTHKSPGVFGLPGVSDFEPQTSRRFAEYTVRMFTGGVMRSLNDFYHMFSRAPRVPSLFDLAAVRWIIVDTRAMPPDGLLTTLPTRWEHDGVKVPQNSDALPRAFWVPRLEVVETPAVLDRLAALPRPDHVLVESVPADGFVGSLDTTASGRVVSLVDTSERVVARVEATGEGFLFVSDQDYPGWTATVNGHETPILRANYAFRAVRVPAGASEVVFRYRPRGLIIGALISLASIAGVLVASLVIRRRRAGRG